ncbi:MAG: tetratricopeptide repeat protein, partial [Gemmatimonadota bacterium]
RQVRLIAEVYDVRDGTKLGQDQVEGSPDEILTLVDRLSVEVLRQILSAEDAHVELGQLPDVDLARVTTGSLPALKAFLQGEALIRRSRFGEATERFRAAVEADSTFALAWYRLGTSRGWLEGLDEDHVADFRRAAELSARLPERERMLLAAALALARNDATAIDLAERAVEEYPDDPEAWYLLGDAQFHLGFVRLAARDASADAFRKALELDPNFAPAYIHLLQIAMIHENDSAATTRLLRLYHGVAAESEYDVAARVAYDFVFGDADTTDARAAADTIGQAVMQPLMFFLGHPAGLRAQGVLLHEIRELPHPAAQIGGTIGLAWNSLARGRLRELQDVLDDPRLPPGMRQDVLLQAALAAFPLPPATFESALALTAVDTTSAEDLLEAGAYAALKGQPEDDRRAREALERLGNRASASGDTAAAASVSAMSRTLEGVELMQAGRFAEATELLEQTRRGLGGNEDRVGLAVALTYVIGDGLLRAGQPAEALPYLLAFPFPTPLLYLRLGQAYEAEERFDEAREAYQLFVLGWRDADPELQPRVREAQAAIRRLSSVIQE